MRSIQDLKIFIETARQGSLSAAARLLDLSPAATSAAVKRLEAELGVPLFIRSTRHLRLTHQGETFLSHCQQALQLLDDGCQAIQKGQTVIQDVLQLSMPSDIGRNLLLGWLDEFLDLYPQIDLRIQLSDRLVNIYRQPVDIALRYGELPDSSLIAVPLVPDNRRVLCASPEYVQQFGTPLRPEDLTKHNCLCFMLGEDVHGRWRFWKNAQEVSVKVRGSRVADDGEAVRRWALAGKGIAYKARLDVIEDLSNGRLVPLCEDWETERTPFNLICADRRQFSPAVQALRQFLSSRLEKLSA
ncbi:LysR family transcriptional regulator [Vreelandella venusta]|uniref:LysR family transcriptional regulator n=1 Tax=Vreelandella venusta TaxID=44935 RepID=UPI00200BAA39|nr:LysR family transcriptional regulator [Halomonas venusta]MDX1714536.1 LysR family transcriptional regulator [Halomonas venusta]UQI39631.1 LysR family transcriptional regulator [Halomonas venusta]WAM47692.1 LysR family transcriptional regulator [Halomonas venusta]WAM51183.1 LysR family transcriptional regulator [Halomonas venusta]